MDFFSAQDLARRQTKRLVLLFVLAIVAIVISIYFVFAGIAIGVEKNGDSPGSFVEQLWNPPLLILVTAGTLLVIGLGSIWKFLELRSGGASVAEMLGGRRLANNTADAEERVVLNVVEEMALASGIPVPPVYVLDNEKSINAFAAGHGPGDCVIGVNRGTIHQLTRDELQGVIAHEYSHILSGDMRLNLRLMALLNGILVLSIIGYYLLRAGAMSGGSRGGKNNSGGPYIAIIGICVFIIGSVGLFFSKVIKAAISRQREYLADASAVQFTRNPDSIGGALKMLARYGSKLDSENAESASHMFFGSSTTSWLSTHPPLDDRIKRVDPSFQGDIKPYLERRSRLSAAGMAFSSGTSNAGGTDGGSNQQVDSESASKRTESMNRSAAARFPFPFPVGTGGGAGGADAIAGRFSINPAVLLAAIGTPTTNDVEYAQQLMDVLPKELLDAAHEGYGARCVVFALLLDADESIRSEQLKIVETREGDVSAGMTAQLYGLLSDIDKRYRLPVIEIVQSSLVELSLPQYRSFRQTLVDLVRADQKISLLEFVLYHHSVSHLDRWYKQTPPVRITVRNSMAIKDELRNLLGYLA